MKKFYRLIATVIVLTVFLSITTYASQNITDYKTPTVSSELAFSKKFGSKYKAVPTPPIAVENTVILASGVKLYKLDGKTGEEISSVKMQGSSLYSTVSPFYADGKIFVQLDGGIVQAFDYKTLKSLWVYTDALGGQALCPITYSDSYVYTGFWNGETEYANYICLSTADEKPREETEAKKATWTYKSLGGFYWAGCCVTDKFAVFGKDNGQNDSTSNSYVVSLDKSTGKQLSSIKVKGDIRSDVTYYSESDAFYVSSKAGYVYKFNVNSSTGKLTLLASYKASGSVTSTPVIYKNRLYIGSQKGTYGEFAVIDAEKMTKIYSCDMTAYPQATMLISNAYEKSTGKIYIYSTYNGYPGGITVFSDSAGQTTAEKNELFTPSESMSQYCISTISAGKDGTLYYKNDSGYIFAITSESSTSSVWENIILFFKAIINFFKQIFS